MSHDEIGGTVTRKERRKAYGGKRQAAPRHVFNAAAHVRNDWSTEDLIESLERRAPGYNGMLRALLCTAAAKLRTQTRLVDKLLGQVMDAQDEKTVDASALMPVGVEDPPEVSNELTARTP